MSIKERFLQLLTFLEINPWDNRKNFKEAFPHIEKELVFRQVGGMKNRSNAVVVCRLLLAIVIVFICWRWVNGWLLSFWLAFCFMHAMAGLKSTDDFFQSPTAMRDIKFWKARTAQMTFVSGLIWGFAGYFFLPAHSPIDQVIIIAFIAAVAFGSVPLYASWLPGMWAFLPPILIPPYVKLVVLYHVPAGTAWLLALVLFSIVMYFGLRLNQVFSQGIFQSIERERLMEQLLHQQQKAEFAREASEMAIANRTKFFAGANHDLRQPLQAMGIFISILESQADPKTKPLIENLSKACHSVSTLVDQILMISKLESKSMKVSRSSFNVKNLFDELQKEFMPMSEKKKIGFEVQCPSVTLFTDEFLLGRVLRNLLGNSFKYSEKGTIYLRAKETRQGSLMITVADEGNGMDKKEQENIFKEFVRGKAGRRAKEGFGLGLSIVKKIVDLLGIKIAMHSRPGKGTIFHMVVPITTEAEQIKVLEEVGTSDKIHSLDGIFIVLIEDDQLIRTSLETLLLGWGAKVKSAEYFDAKLTVELLQGEAPDLILSDFNLGPGRLTGLQSVFRIRSALGKRIPAIITTAVSRDVVIDQYEEETEGLDFSEKRSDIMQLPVIMQKPVTPAELNHVISRQLKI